MEVSDGLLGWWLMLENGHASEESIGNYDLRMVLV
jgi:hypothetical protein